jgi:hypothetical protein
MHFTSLIRNNEFKKSGYQKITQQEYFGKQLQNSNVIKPLTFFNLFRNILLNFGDFYTLQLFWQVFLAEMGCLVSSMPIENCIKCVYFISLEFFFESKLKSKIEIRLNTTFKTYSIFLLGHKWTSSDACSEIPSTLFTIRA